MRASIRAPAPNSPLRLASNSSSEMPCKAQNSRLFMLEA